MKFFLVYDFACLTVLLKLLKYNLFDLQSFKSFNLAPDILMAIFEENELFLVWFSFVCKWVEVWKKERWKKQSDKQTKKRLNEKNPK